MVPLSPLSLGFRPFMSILKLKNWQLGERATDSYRSVTGRLLVGYWSLNAHGHLTDSQRPVNERAVTGRLPNGQLLVG